MALLFVEGFDSLATADLDESFTSITGSPTVGSTYKRNGAIGVQLSSGDYLNLTLTATTTAAGVTGMALYRIDGSASSFFDLRNGGGPHLYLRIESGLGVFFDETRKEKRCSYSHPRLDRSSLLVQ